MAQADSILPLITPDHIMRGVPTNFNVREGLGEHIFNRLKENKERVAMVDAVSGEEITRGQILIDAVTVAEALRGMGVRPGDMIGFCSENRLEFVVPVLATLFVGAACAPLNPLYSIQELKHTMDISQPSIVFCSPSTATAKLLEVKKEMPFLKKIITFDEVKAEASVLPFKDLLRHPVNPATFVPARVDYMNSVCVLLCSSGTTGLPKCVELTDNNVRAFIENFSDPKLAGENVEKQIILGLVPFFHGYGFSVLLLCMAAQMKIIVMSRFDEKCFLESIQNHKVSLLFAVPPLMVFLAKHPLVSAYDLSSINKIRCGAAPLSKDVQLAVQKRLNLIDVQQAYGLTEVSVASVINPIGKNKVGSSGVVVPGMDCKVIDIETGKALPPYKEGELCFKGPLVMKGYRKNKKATDETISEDGWLRTGDIAYYDMEGYLFIVDRLKELIKYKGFQVPPAELEAILLSHPAVKDAAVIGIPDEVAGELPFAFIARAPDTHPTEEEIKKFVAEKVSAQKRLAGGVRFIDEIPKNPSGKILRRELRLLYKTKSKL